MRSKEEKREYDRKYRAEHLEASLSARKARQSDPVKRRADNERRRAHYRANIERAREKSRLHYAANREKYKKAARDWKANNPERRKAVAIKHTYGLSPEQYQTLLHKQSGLCGLCYKPGKLVVDHDHKTGQVRGLIHGHCNSGIGYLKDDPELCRLAASYLEKFKC